MATITEIRSAGTTLATVGRPIYEPIAAPQSLERVLQRFDEHYDLSQGSYLYRFLLALCGETGAGQVKKELLYPKLQQSIESTHFSDLDRLYGTPLGLPRIDPEIYIYDPKDEILNQSEWAEVRAKDAAYRARCLTWMRAILHGGTPQGIELAAEAATGVDCQVFEQYQWVEDQIGDRPVDLMRLYSFETNDFSDWLPPANGGGGATYSIVLDGVQGARAAEGVVPPGDFIQLRIDELIPIDITKPYTFTAYFKKVSGISPAQTIMRIRCYDSEGYIGSVYPNIATIGAAYIASAFNPFPTWTRWGGVIHGDEGTDGNGMGGFILGTTNIQIEILTSYLPVSTATVRVDGIVFEEGTTPSTIEDAYNRQLGKTRNRREFVIIPRGETTPAEQRRTMRLVDRLRPVNSIATIFDHEEIRLPRAARAVSSTTDYFQIKRYVTGRQDINWPEPDRKQGLWITSEEEEVPSFSWFERQEGVTFLTITNATASSYHVGPFSREQRALFGHLSPIYQVFKEFDPNKAYAKATAPISLSIPWIDR